MDMMTYAKIMPVANEIELHPYLTQESMVSFCKKYDILPIGFSPLARAGNEDRHGPKGIYETEVIKEMCEKYCRSPAQI
jgi:diketogulonate reductase-like aldo/keto reductase